MINTKRTYLGNEKSTLTRAQRRQNEKQTQQQKHLRIREMYQVLDTHLVQGVNDAGVAMDLEEFKDFVKSPWVDVKDIDRKYRRMLTIYEGVKKDVQEYVDSRYAEKAAAQKQLDRVFQPGVK
jgi:hypothetical protein